jgi:hypothetical protein
LAIKKQIAYAGMGIATVLVSLLLLSTLVGWSLWLTLVCGLAHASLRDATALIDAAEANQVLHNSVLYSYDGSHCILNQIHQHFVSSSSD